MRAPRYPGATVDVAEFIARRARQQAAQHAEAQVAYRARKLERKRAAQAKRWRAKMRNAGHPPCAVVSSSWVVSPHRIVRVA